MRAFLAIQLPEGLRRAAAEAVRTLTLPQADWRLVPVDGLHITIRFLGDLEAAERARHDAAWRAAASCIGPVVLRLRGAAAFPNARRPRVIGLGVDDRGGAGALAAMAARTEDAARALGFAPERRAFSPHVTVARARGDSARLPSLARVDVVGEFVAAELVLYRSELGPGGARYHEEGSFPFSGSLVG
jgi:2'-5' RNA ligase